MQKLLNMKKGFSSRCSKLFKQKVSFTSTSNTTLTASHHNNKPITVNFINQAHDPLCPQTVLFGCWRFGEWDSLGGYTTHTNPDL